MTTRVFARRCGLMARPATQYALARFEAIEATARSQPIAPDLIASYLNGSRKLSGVRFFGRGRRAATTADYRRRLDAYSRALPSWRSEPACCSCASNGFRHRRDVSIRRSMPSRRHCCFRWRCRSSHRCQSARCRCRWTMRFRFAARAPILEAQSSVPIARPIARRRRDRLHCR